MDSSIRARIHFAEHPINPYIQKLIGKERATAVTWYVQGIRPYGSFELQVRYQISGGVKVTCRHFAEAGQGQPILASPTVNLLSMRFVVVCRGNSGWRYRTQKEAGVHIRDGPVIVADEKGKAQGVSIERDLRVQDVLGRMIVIREVAPLPDGGESPSLPPETTPTDPSLSVVGVQDMDSSP